jgi:hypothetical protein
VGGDRAWRNNNPGNVRPGAIARANGAIGQECNGDYGCMAVFPDRVTGEAAQEALLRDSYGGRTIRQMISAYAPPRDGNDTEGYIRYVTRRTGLDENTVLVSRDARGRTVDHVANVAEAMRAREGWRPGTTRQIP